MKNTKGQTLGAVILGATTEEHCCDHSHHHAPRPSSWRANHKELPSYDDRNMYFEGMVEESADLKPFVLKLSNAHLYTPELVDGLTKMMLFVESRGFTCSSPIASRTGQYSHMATEQELLGGMSAADDGEEETVEYPVRVMKYIPGELMDKLDKCYLTPQLSYDVGHYVGRMDHALQVHAVDTCV